MRAENVPSPFPMGRAPRIAQHRASLAGVPRSLEEVYLCVPRTGDAASRSTGFAGDRYYRIVPKSRAGGDRRRPVRNRALFLAFAAHPDGRTLLQGLADIPYRNRAYFYLAAANIGAVITPRIISCQKTTASSAFRRRAMGYAT